MRRCAGWFGSVLFALLAASSAFADGMYFPPIAYPKMPEIPAQRAIIVHKDGVETLIVESAVKSAAGRVAWILPLPAPPTKIEAADPGPINTMWFCTRPDVVHSYREEVTRTLEWILGGFGVIGALGWILRPKGRPDRLGLVVWAIVGLFLLAFLLIPTLGTAGTQGLARAAPGVELLQVRQAGSYEVKVIKAETAAAVSDWLAGGEFQRPDTDAARVIGDYISKGWCFAVAAMKVPPGEPARPHPLFVTFPVKEPVYPMRLTQRANSNMALELYVVAAKRAAHPLMTVEFADVLRAPDPTIKTSHYTGRLSHGIGLGELVPILWDQCVLTKLTGKIPAAAMGEDFRIQLDGGRLVRHTRYSRRGALGAGLEYALIVLVAVAIGLTVRFVGNDVRRFRETAAITGGGVLLAAIVGATVYAALPKIEARPSMRSRYTRDPYVYAEFVVWELRGTGALKPEMTDAQIGAAVETKFHDRRDGDDALYQNPFLGGRVRFERSPGNFGIAGRGTDRSLVLFGATGKDDEYGPIPLFSPVPQ